MLQKGKVIPKQSRLMALDPKLEKELLVVGGRINHAAISYESQHTIIQGLKHHPGPEQYN